MTDKTSLAELQLLTVAEIAKLQRISERQVRRQIAGGELPHYRMGTAIRISRADLEIFLAQRRHNQETIKKRRDLDHRITAKY